eukprot:9423-Heterococcus_DN1.PRE.1
MNAHRTPSVHQRTESTIAPPFPRPSLKLCHAQKRHYLSDQGSSDSPANLLKSCSLLQTYTLSLY